MKTPVWIPKSALLAVHEELLARFGGLGGLRDEGLLESALARPLRLAEYGQPDFFELATAYASGIVRNHPFADGNKRAGFMAAYIFLGINGLEFDAPEEEIVLQTLGLAAGEVSEEDYAIWLRASCGKPAKRKRRG